jgi:hypothetical protein
MFGEATQRRNIFAFRVRCSTHPGIGSEPIAQATPHAEPPIPAGNAAAFALCLIYRPAFPCATMQNNMGIDSSVLRREVLPARRAAAARTARSAR